jgi:DNA-binding transcriptional LysR family regulator
MRGLEERLGVRLLTRTTRSVSPTEAGERLLQSVVPQFQQIEAGLDALGEFRNSPTGTIRITTAEHAANTILWPRIASFAPRYPDIKIEVIVDYGLADIVADRFDAGIRLGESVAKDMIAVRIGPDWRMSVVATPDYFAARPTPKRPEDLTDHNCINMRLPTYGGLFPWEFSKRRRRINVRVDGQLVFNSSSAILRAARAGLGLAWIAEDLSQPFVASGEMVSVLEDWCEPFSGYHLYYPSRRQASPAFALFVEAMRYRG